MENYNVKIIKTLPVNSIEYLFACACYGDFVKNHYSDTHSIFCNFYEVDSLEQARSIVKLFNRWCDEEHAFDKFYDVNCNDCGVGWFLDPVTKTNFYVAIGVSLDNHSHLVALEELIAVDGTIDADKIAKVRAAQLS